MTYFRHTVENGASNTRKSCLDFYFTHSVGKTAEMLRNSVKDIKSAKNSEMSKITMFNIWTRISKKQKNQTKPDIDESILIETFRRVK